MKIKVTRTTVANGEIVRAGGVYDVPDSDARTLILLGKAVAAAVDPVAAVPAEPELTTENFSDVVDTDKPFKRVKSRKGSK